MFAVIKTGGKQYLVQEGDVVKVEKLDAVKGDTVEVELLLTADGDKLDIGMPLLAKKVQVEVLDEGRAKKVEVVHFKAKSRYTKRFGHRQPFTTIKIAKIF